MADCLQNWPIRDHVSKAWCFDGFPVETTVCLIVL